MSNSISWTAYIKQLGEEQAMLIQLEQYERARKERNAKEREERKSLPLLTRARWDELSKRPGRLASGTRMPITLSWRKEYYTHEYGCEKTWLPTWIFGRTGKWLRLRGHYWDWHVGEPMKRGGMGGAELTITKGDVSEDTGDILF